MHLETLHQTRYATEVLAVLSIVGISVLASCGSPEMPTVRRQPVGLRYVPEDIRRGVQWACLFESPIIVAGKIVAVQHKNVQGIVGPLDFPIAEVRLIIEVGAVVQGDTAGPRIEATGYVVRTQDQQPWKMNPPAPTFERGQERLFFFRKSEGRVRLVRDVFDHSLPLYGGIRLPTRFASFDQKHQGVALLLLPPKEDNFGRWRIHALSLLTQAEHILGAEELDRFLIAERIVEDMPAELVTTFQENVNAFRLYYPQTKVRSHIPSGGCGHFGPED